MVIIDYWGIIKADIGIRDGRIVAIGKAGNPDIMSGVHPDLVVGPSTEIIAGNGRIVTAGAIDCHVHLICPQIMEEALGGGITTIVAGGTGPAEGSKATTVTPGSWHLARMLESLDSWPLNVALLGKGNTVSAEAMWEQLRGGAAGFKLHEDWGTTPAAIDACLTVADAAGVQVNIHTDTLNEMGFVEDTLAAIDGRSIHAYHTEGAGGGHARGDRPTVLISLTDDPSAGPVLDLGARATSRRAGGLGALRCPDRRAARPRPRIECAAGSPRGAPKPTPCTWCRRRPHRSAATPSRCGSSSSRAHGCGCAARRRRSRCPGAVDHGVARALGARGGGRARPRSAADDRGGGSRHSTSTRLSIAGAGRVRLRERVQIGRTDERQGFWSGSLHADVDGQPLLRHRVELGTGLGDRRRDSARRWRASANCAIRKSHSKPLGTVLELAAGGSLATWQGERLGAG